MIKNFTLLIILGTAVSTALYAEAPSEGTEPGPHYFVSDDVNPTQYYWRREQFFANVGMHTNLNLLAYALGDLPVQSPEKSLVPPEYYFFGGQHLLIQPFAEQSSAT